MIITCALMVTVAPAGDRDRSSTALNMYAAVFMVRGSVVGSTISHFGPFVRTGDTTWGQLMSSNVFAFGLGYFGDAKTNRYYLAAGNGLHRSTDRVHWRVITGWQTMEVLDVIPDPVDSALIYIGTPWGIYRSKDDGNSWHECAQGFRHWFARLGGMDPRSRSTIFAMAEDDLYRTTDGGDHWESLGAGGSILSFVQPPGQPDLLVVGLEDEGVKFSTDGGRSWNAGKGLEGTTIYALGSSPDGTMLYAGGWKTGLWHSVDTGKTWERLWDPADIEALFCIFVDPGNISHLVAGTDGQGAYESFDAGKSWKQAGLYGGKVKQIAMYP